MRQVEFEGTTHQFPDDFTDADVAKALGRPAAPATAQPDLARETARATSMRGRPEPPGALPEFGDAYKQHVAKPLTNVVEPLVSAWLTPPPPLRRILEPFYERRVSAAKEHGYDLPHGTEIPGAIAETVVPQTPIEAGAMVGTMAAGPLAPLLRAVPGLRFFMRPPGARITGAAVGGEAGGQVSGATTGEGALVGGGMGAVGEMLGAGGGALTRRIPGAKSRIAEGEAREMRGAMESINPAVREPIEQAVISPEMRGPRAQTAARIKRANESGAMQEAVSTRMQGQVDEINRLAGNPTFSGTAIDRAYTAMPDLAREDLVVQFGPPQMVSVQGRQVAMWSLEQAQAIRAWQNSLAFTMSPRGQGVGPGPQQRLTGEISDIIDRRLGRIPEAQQLWRQANREYGVEALMEGLTKGSTRGSAFTGLPNRIYFNRSPVSEFLAENEEAIVRRIGRENFDMVVERVLSGGQPGTRDILTPGAGTVGEAARQSIGRGTNTGSMQGIGAPLRTALPNLGSQYTGRAPYTLPPSLQAILDVGMQKLGGAGLESTRR